MGPSAVLEQEILGGNQDQVYAAEDCGLVNKKIGLKKMD